MLEAKCRKNTQNYKSKRPKNTIPEGILKGQNKHKQTNSIMKHERLKPMQSCNKPKTTKELEAQNKNHQYI